MAYETIKETFSFTDADHKKATIETEITTRNGYPEFTASGDYNGGLGQCLDEIKPRTKAQKDFIKTWKNHHLKNVEDIPGFIEGLKECIIKIKEEEREYQENPLSPEEIEQLKTQLEDDKIKALKEALDLEDREILDINERYEGVYEVGGIDYYVLDEEETDKRLEDHLRETASYFNPDFLASMTDLDEEVFKALVDKNEAVFKLIEKTCGVGEFIEEMINEDGVGHFLNGYDGNNEEVTINGTFYNIGRC